MYHDDLGACLQVGKVFSVAVGGIASTVENDARGTAVDEPASDDHAETAETAGDDVRAIRADNRVTLARTECRASEPFDVSALPPPGDHVIVARRLELGGQRRYGVVARVQIDQGGAQVWMLVGEHPDETFERADRRIAPLIAVNHKTVAGDQPHPRRLPVPAADDRAHRRGDRPDTVTRMRQPIIGVGAVELALADEDDHTNGRKVRICCGFRERLQHGGFI